MNPSDSFWSKGTVKPVLLQTASGQILFYEKRRDVFYTEKASWHRFASGGKRDKKLVECLFWAAKTAFFALPASLDWI
ncbi:hypothetical protein ABER61_12800 [Brevibacillus formosus]|uniref:Uncharacterized protein n=1 Tax=Brevibacillus formosus TaxID=54913 RepID=A0A837KVH2_9BACL|nr:hypothetical protein [Brevibacillus formosus]KLI00957.1 hypothetical protein AA984_03325 [Brevibacillus formosus]MED1956043.1 hypothetical protein [Brevibacillus formosus]